MALQSMLIASCFLPMAFPSLPYGPSYGLPYPRPILPMAILEPVMAFLALLWLIMPYEKDPAFSARDI